MRHKGMEGDLEVRVLGEAGEATNRRLKNRYSISNLKTREYNIFQTVE